MYKIIIIAILSVGFLYEIAKHILSSIQKKKALPYPVRNVYDEAEYKKWSAYSHERARAAIIEKSFAFVLMTSLLATDTYALIYDILPGGEYVKSILLMLVFTAFFGVLSVPFEYYSGIKIEEKYGFNNSDTKTFMGDQIKGFIINCVF